MKNHRIFKSTLVGFFLGILVIACVAQTYRGPVTTTTFTRTLLDDENAASARSTLGITGSTNYSFETSQFKITGDDSDIVNLKDGLTVSNLIVKAAMTNDFATASRALFTDANKKVVSSTVTTAELELMQGVTDQPAGTNLFQANQFDIRADNIGVKDSAKMTNLNVYTQLLVDDGTAALPGVAGFGDPDTGLQIGPSGNNEIYFITLGNVRWEITSGGGIRPNSASAYDIGALLHRVRDTFTDRVAVDDGSGATPSFGFANDTDTGIYRVGADQIGFTVGGTARWRIDSAGIWTFTDNTYDIGKDGTFRPRDLFIAGEAKVGDGAVGTPSLSFDADEDSGVYRIGADNVGVSVGGAEVLDIQSSEIEYSSSAPRLMLNETDAAADEALWFMKTVNGKFILGTWKDDRSSIDEIIKINRTGYQVDDVVIELNGSQGLLVGDNLTETALGTLDVQSDSNGDMVLRLIGESGGGIGDITENHYMARIETTDATVSTLHTVPITASRTYLIEARVTARRTGGSAGTADDGAVYIRRAMVTTKSGTVTINAVDTELTQEDQAGWDCTLDVSGSNIRVRVTGAANNTIDWACKVLSQAQGIGG